jgi:cell division septation protein DedD
VNQQPEKIEDVIGDVLKDVRPEDIKPTPAPKRKELVLPEEKIVSESGSRIQLGAFRTAQDAEEKWQELSSQFTSLLSEKRHFTERADLGSKGIFYRLQVGPITNAAEGKSICQKLIENNQGCFFVR